MSAVATLPDSGQRIGRYQPIRRLAVGGMAEIYLARLPGVGIEGFEKLVVLKRILPQHALDPELLRMFLDEARLSATLTHPHVTEVYDVGADGAAPFFAMEYVHGANLREILRAHARRSAAARGAALTVAAAPAGRAPSGAHAMLAAPLPLPQAIGIVAAAASGLHYAHDRMGPGGEPLGIVHRDVSPSNVLVSYDGAVKVSDFGIAKWAYQRTRTQEGTLKGKFAYMSPEQCRGRGVDRRSDVFALGAILYEMTTGVAAFSGASDLDILNQIATGSAAPPAWADGGEKYPAALSAIVMRALAPDPADRYPTMQALQIALEAFAREAGLVISTVELGGFIQELFADDLAAWRAAQHEGKSLGEHLAGRPAAPATGDAEERTATDGYAPTRLRAQTARAKAGRLRQGLALAGFVAVSAFAGGMTVKIWKGNGETAATAGGAPPAPALPVAPAPAADLRVRLPGVPRLSETSATAPVPPEPIPAATVAPRPKARARTQARASAPLPASPPAPRATAEARLGAWDPDSPVPP